MGGMDIDRNAVHGGCGTVRVRRRLGSLLVVAFASVGVLSPTAVQAQAPAPSGESPDRNGFTLLLNLGIGIQHDATLDETNTGLGGLNLGIGGFVTDKTAVLFRVSGTNVDLDFAEARQLSGFVGPSLQYWADDRVALEGGVGIGFWEIEGNRETGLGLLFGVSYAVIQNARHSFSVGIEFAPAFTDPDAVHNLGVVFGWQLL